MQWLTNFFGWIMQPLTSIPAERRWRLLGWVVHILLVILIVAGLAYLNWYTHLDRVLRTRVLNLNKVWLPLLFLIAYTIYWLIRWLYWLLGPDGPAGEFDDIEAAWAAGKHELDRAGLSLSEIPVFLVLGQPSAPIDQVFSATRIPFQVRYAPRGPAPLHVYATREAIYVTCEGASLMPVQTERLQADDPPPTPEAATLDPVAAAGPAPGGTESLPEPETAPAVLLLGEPEPAGTAGPVRTRNSLLLEKELVDLQKRRLRQVCRLLLRDRQPYCPVNGILALVPLLATATADDTAETAAVLRQDFEVARTALQLDCPRLIILCDVEKLPGFGTLIRQFPEGEENKGRHWVLGQHFPLVPDVPARQQSALYEDGMGWVADSLLPLVVGKLFRREGEPGAPDRQTGVSNNSELYEFLHSCRLSIRQLGKLAGRAVESDTASPYLGGCYLAGTGEDSELGQGFLAGILLRLIELQNSVRWIDDATSDDAAYHRYAQFGYILLAIFVVIVLSLVWTWW